MKISWKKKKNDFEIKFKIVTSERKLKWRREQESNLHRLTPGGFQDRCNTIMRSLRNERTNKNIAQPEKINKRKVYSLFTGADSN